MLRNVRIRLHVQYDSEWSVRSYNNCIMKSGTTEYYYVYYTVVWLNTRAKLGVELNQ